MDKLPETIKVEVEESLAKRFRKKAMEKHGYKKGAVKKALEEAMRRYATESKADWDSLLGTLRIDRDSVWLQHHAWGDSD